MDMFRTLAITVAAAGGVLMSGASGAQAATACTDATLGNFGGSNAQQNLDAWLDGTNGGSDDFVTVSNGSLMCEFSDLGKTNPSAETEQEVSDNFFTSVNLLSFPFRWNEIDKDEGFTSDGLLQTSDNGGGGFDFSGNWTIKSDLFDDPLFNTALLVFKDGNADPDTFVAYKVERTGPGDVTGEYSSMFFGNSGLKSDAVSHVSLFGGFNPDLPVSVIPLPAGLPLLLSAIGIGGLLRLRQRKAA